MRSRKEVKMIDRVIIKKALLVIELLIKLIIVLIREVKKDFENSDLSRSFPYIYIITYFLCFSSVVGNNFTIKKLFLQLVLSKIRIIYTSQCRVYNILLLKDLFQNKRFLIFQYFCKATTLECRVLS